MPVCLHCLTSAAHRRTVELAQQQVNDKRAELEAAEQALLDAEMAMYHAEHKHMMLVQACEYPDDFEPPLWDGLEYSDEE